MSGTTAPTRGRRSERGSRAEYERCPPLCLGSPPHPPSPRRLSLRTPLRTGKAWPALPKFPLQLLPKVPEESLGCGPQQNLQHQHGRRHVARPKTTPTGPLGPAPTSSMRTHAEPGKRAPGTTTPSMPLKAALPFLQSERGKGRRGEGK